MNLVRPLATVVATGILLAGCGGDDGAGSGTPTVVATFYPLEYVAQRVAGGHAEVVNLTTPGAEPHDLELTVQQTAEVSDADVAFYQQGFQPAVDEAIEQNEPDHVVETSQIVTLEPTSADEDEHEEETAEEHSEHADQESEGEGGDPHFWLDPTRLSEVAAAFEDEMAAADPDHAADYERNLKRLQADLAALDEGYRKGLTGCEVDTVVVSHDAFGYLGKYGLEFEPISGLSPDAEPSPAHIAALQELVKSENVTTVFSETLASPALAETLAGDLGLGTGVLDPIEGLAETTADEDYVSLMDQNLAALRKANGCS